MGPPICVVVNKSCWSFKLRTGSIIIAVLRLIASLAWLEILIIKYHIARIVVDVIFGIYWCPSSTLFLIYGIGKNKESMKLFYAWASLFGIFVDIVFVTISVYFGPRPDRSIVTDLVSIIISVIMSTLVDTYFYIVISSFYKAHEPDVPTERTPQ